MTDPSSDLLNLRKSVRYFVKKPEAIQVHIEYDADGVRRRERCELLDVSTHGLKVKAASVPKIHQPVRLHLRVDACRVNLELAGSICWSRPRENDYCWIGILLQDEIAPSQLDRFAVQGIIDRRRDRRLTIGADALIRFELNSSSVPAKILDLSPGGFSVVTAGKANAGDRILLLVPRATDEGDPIPARILWVRAEQEETMLGCEFLSTMAAIDVRARLTLRESQQESMRAQERLARRERTLPLLIPAACTAVLFCWHYGAPSTASSEKAACLAPPVHLDRNGTSLPTQFAAANIDAGFHPLNPYVDWFFHQWQKLYAEPGSE